MKTTLVALIGLLLASASVPAVAEPDPHCDWNREFTDPIESTVWFLEFRDGVVCYAIVDCHKLDWHLDCEWD